MAAPLNVGDRTIGVVETVGRAGGAEFTSADLERFAGCCGLIAVALENASLYRRLARDSEIIRRVHDHGARPLIAESAEMRRALDQAERAAAGRSTILLTGETGTGKEHVARRIHERSPRASGPFVAINCAALPEGLVESELFGHEKGAFTGADRRRIGWFELADGGTLLLDEIGDLPAPAQGRLLRVLQEREINRVGGTQAIPVNVRLIAATHRNLAAEVRSGRFRDDLFFRLHVVPIRLPPLRERPDDIEPLARMFLDRFAVDLGRTTRRLTPEALALLRAHHWPGNVRELENLAERLLVLGGEQAVGAAELSGLLPDTPVPTRAQTPTHPRLPSSTMCRSGSRSTRCSYTRWSARMETRPVRRPAQDQPRATSHADAAIRVAAEAVTSRATWAVGGTPTLSSQAPAQFLVRAQAFPPGRAVRRGTRAPGWPSAQQGRALPLRRQASADPMRSRQRQAFP